MSNFPLKRLQQGLKNKKDEIMRNQKAYRQLVKELYDETQPFNQRRADTKKNFAEELKILFEMIGHCIVLGDSKILYTYAIYPIRRNPRILSSFSRIDSYLEALYEKHNKTKSTSAKFYLKVLMNELKLLGAKGREVAQR